VELLKGEKLDEPGVNLIFGENQLVNKPHVLILIDNPVLGSLAFFLRAVSRGVIAVTVQRHASQFLAKLQLGT